MKSDVLQVLQNSGTDATLARIVCGQPEFKMKTTSSVLNASITLLSTESTHGESNSDHCSLLVSGHMGF